MTVAAEQKRIDYDLRRRTPGEELWLWRRRRLSTGYRADGEPHNGMGRDGSGMRQREAAAACGAGLTEYRYAEMDMLPERDIREMLERVRSGDDHEPSRGELCALARRRSGMTLEAARCAVGLSHVAYLQHERRADDDVAAFWSGVGFTF